MNKGIILAGGTGSRLSPISLNYSKHLIDVGKRPIIDYPINTLKSFGITDITIVLGDKHFEQIISYLKDGSAFGVNFNFIYQSTANGVAAGINLCRQYVENADSFIICLGDNVFQKPIIWDPIRYNPLRAKIVLCDNPGIEISRFGVASINSSGKIVKIKEKPKVIDHTLKNYAITGCYCFNSDYFDYFRYLKLSDRREFEIVDIIRQYIDNNDLDYTFTAGWWSDCGEFSSLYDVRDLIKQFPVEFKI